MNFHAVRRGVEHLPVAPEECWIMFMEPAQTKHTGEVETEHITEQTAHLGPQVSQSEA